MNYVLRTEVCIVLQNLKSYEINREEQPRFTDNVTLPWQFKWHI
jgi:hypothetical protein